MPQQAPYGDIFSAATPALDQLSNRLYADQKQREAKAAQVSQQLDANMQKEFANVRSKDTPDVINSYQKYKDLKKQLLFNKDIQHDPIKYNAVQQQANEALANTYGVINGSVQQKEKEKTLAAAHLAHPDEFADNFGDLLTAAQNTPVSKLQGHALGDLSNPETYAYKGSNTDFQKIGATAAGQPSIVYAPETPVDATGLQFKTTPYKYPNSPAKYYQSYMGALAEHKAGRDAGLAFDALTQDQKDYVDKAYNALTPDDWLKRTGSPTPQPLVPVNPNNKAEQFAIFQSKLHTISNEPEEQAPKFRTDEGKKFQMETNRQMKMEQIKHADAKDLALYKKDINPNDAELNNLWVDKYIQSIKDTPTGLTTKTIQNGKPVYEKNIPLDPVLSESLKKAGVSPISLTTMSDGRFRINYPVRDKEGNPVKTSTGTGAGGYAVDNSLSVPITEQQLAVALGKKNSTGKARGKEILNALNNAPTNPVNQQNAEKKAQELLKKYMP